VSLNDNNQAAAANTTTATPLTYLTGDVNLNDLRTNGIYISPGKVAANHPAGEDTVAAWSLQVFASLNNGKTYITQIYTNTNGTWWRSSTDNGDQWSPWKRFSDEIPSAMPLEPTQTNDLNKIVKNGFYLSTGTGATNAPSSNGAWVLMVLAAPYSGQSYIMQTFYTDKNVWWRFSQNNGDKWSEWASMIDLPAMPLKTLSSTDGKVNLDKQYDTGFYFGDGLAPLNPPGADTDPDNKNAGWALQVMRYEKSGTDYVFITQLFYSNHGIWWRKTDNSGYNWSDWKEVTGEVPSAMPLNPAPSNDLNQIKTDGFYRSKGTAATHAPSNSADWALSVLSAPSANPTYITQTFYAGTNVWLRSSSNNGSTWSEWKDIFKEIPPAMPLKPAPTNDLNQIKTSGFYQSTGSLAQNRPPGNNDHAWVLIVVAAPEVNPTYVMQTYQSYNGVWWRKSQNNGEKWSDWTKEITEIPEIPPAMPLKKLSSTNGKVDLDKQYDTGFYFGDGTAPLKPPGASADPDNKNAAWALQVMRYEKSGTEYVFITQLFYSNLGIWRRKTDNSGYNWSEWKEIIEDIPPAMPLNPVPTSDLDKILESGFYQSTGVPAVNGPDSTNRTWTLLVVASHWENTHFIMQTYHSFAGDWVRKSQNSDGSYWTKWIYVLNEESSSTMPLLPAPTNDLNKILKNGFYQSTGVRAQNGPSRSTDYAWDLLVVASNVGSSPFIMQTYDSYAGGWWRKSNDNGTSWTRWTEWATVPSSGSAYLLGDAVIPNNHLVPFAQSGPSRELPFDLETGEFVITHAGTYSLTASLHLSNNQKASFAISIDGETPEHHTALHYEPASSVLTGHFSSSLTSIIECKEGQRVGIKNITGASVTLWHAVNGRRSKHELILTQLYSDDKESE
jgi:hypothetical protein